MTLDRLDWGVDLNPAYPTNWYMGLYVFGTKACRVLVCFVFFVAGQIITFNESTVSIRKVYPMKHFDGSCQSLFIIDTVDNFQGSITFYVVRSLVTVRQEGS